MKVVNQSVFFSFNPKFFIWGARGEAEREEERQGGKCGGTSVCVCVCVCDPCVCIFKCGCMFASVGATVCIPVCLLLSEVRDCLIFEPL